MGLGFMVQSLAADDRGITKMAQQVKDVLPHVPLNVIASDLGKLIKCFCCCNLPAESIRVIYIDLWLSPLCAAFSKNQLC